MKHRRLFLLISAIAFAIVLSLVAHVVYLLVLNYRSQSELRENLVIRLKQDSEIHAASIGYFLSERKEDVANMAFTKVITDFFENKALGMSKEYGLNISLIQIKDLFIGLMKHKQVENGSIYSRIVLIDRNGSVLVDVMGSDQQRPGPNKWNTFLAPEDREGVITTSHDRKELLVSVPCYHKNKYAGQIIAVIKPEIMDNILRNLKSPTASVMFLVTQKGDYLMPVGATPSFQGLDLPELLSRDTGEIKELETGRGDSVRRKIIALRMPVKDTRFFLMRIVDQKDVVGELNPHKLLVNMVIQALVIFMGLFLTLGLTARYMILQTKLRESAARERDIGEKNRQLESEIVERKRAEEAMLKAIEASEAANRAKTLFLSNMSHEVRTPMSGVLGMAGLLLETPLTEKQRYYAEKIRRSGELLLAILNNVLDFAKSNAGKLTIGSNPFSIEEVIGNVVRIFGPQIMEKGLKLNTFLDRELPPALLGDPRRLFQIIGNLMDNAIKFTEAGEIRLAAKISRRFEEGVELEISVQDMGIGIREDDLPKLFTAFTQADDSITRRHGGTGMGLAISRSLVELMGGMLRAESIHGKGSTFKAVIPFPIATGGEENAFTKLDVKAKPSTSGLDVEEGLKRLGGSKELYMQSLADFIAGYGEAPDHLVKELRADQRDEAILRIQAVRVVAGNLGGKELEAAAAELEKACQTAVDGLPFVLGEPLRVFIDHHEKLITAIGLVFSQQSPVKPVKPHGPSGNEAELIPLLEKLKISLANEEPRPCKEILATLLQKRWSESHETVLTELSNLVNRYRLAEALCLLDKEFDDILNKKEKK